MTIYQHGTTSDTRVLRNTQSLDLRIAGIEYIRSITSASRGITLWLETKNPQSQSFSYNLLGQAHIDQFVKEITGTYTLPNALLGQTIRGHRISNRRTLECISPAQKPQAIAVA